MQKKIIIKGARVHNLQNISLEVHRNQLIVITGVSGSGKSSLAFDTLYAEGQRRYVESLSSYARQFLGKIQKPDVDAITGIPPSIAIEQKVNNKNPRSTVGTSTEIYDYLKLLFARIGKTISPISNKEVKKDTVKDILNYLSSLDYGKKIMITAPISFSKKEMINEKLQLYISQGFSRIIYQNKILNISDIITEKKLNFNNKSEYFLLIDRIKTQQEENIINRIADSLETAFFEGKGHICLFIQDGLNFKKKSFSNLFELDGITFQEPTVHLFTFNNPIGACPTCGGFGKTIGIDKDLVIPNKKLSVYEEAIMPWRGEKMSKWKDQLIYNADKFNFPIHKPIFELSKEQINLLYTGNKYFEGLNSFFKMLEKESYKIQHRVMLSRYRGKTFCPDCEGKRLRKESSYVKINNFSINDLVDLSIKDLQVFFKNLKLNSTEKEISKRILTEINKRLDFLIKVGLGYLSLNRPSASLSGGESQRINLATSLGSSLVGSLYISDEPSIGLHSHDTKQLISVLKDLQALGNTVIVVEHDEDIMKHADCIIDMGPLAGKEGGEIIFQGNLKNLKKESDSLTAQYLNEIQKIELPKHRRKWKDFIEIIGARENNLKNINVKIPLHTLTVITGVSGSGKSSLVKTILYNGLEKILGIYHQKTGAFDTIQGNYKIVKQVEYIDQNPIGKSSRSNPVTYIKAYDHIRKLFSEQALAKQNGLKPGNFSFNIDGGRCDECKGEGTIKIEMQFMADVYLQCESCEGKRFKQEILDINYLGKNIYDILEMTVKEAISFFNKNEGLLEKRILSRLQLLSDVGLDYIHLGQASNSLSGGESQRIKLASFLGKEDQNHTLFIFDEPTTGLHFYDIHILINVFNALIERGNSVVIIEHNMDIIKSADWIIDLGPEGGDNGGYIVSENTPEKIITNKNSYTAKYLSKKLFL